MIKCCDCGNQIVKDYKPSRSDEYVTTQEDARRMWGNQFVCGYCAEDLDENGMYPEEKAFL